MYIVLPMHTLVLSECFVHIWRALERTLLRFTSLLSYLNTLYRRRPVHLPEVWSSLLSDHRRRHFPSNGHTVEDLYCGCLRWASGCVGDTVHEVTVSPVILSMVAMIEDTLVRDSEQPITLTWLAVIIPLPFGPAVSSESFEEMRNGAVSKLPFWGIAALHGSLR